METSAEQEKNIVYLLIALSSLLAVRLLPILKDPLSSFGYDFGFYFHAADSASWNISQILFGGYNNPIFALGNLLHLPPQITLLAPYFISAIFLGICLYLLMKQFGKAAGIFSVLLLAASPFQAEAYLMFLWKNILALPFLILGFKFLVEKRWTPFILSSLTVLLFHRTTAIIYFLSVGLYFAYDLIKKRSYKTLLLGSVICCLSLAAIYYLFNLRPIIWNLLNNPNTYVRTGLFLENRNLFALWWPALTLGAAGAVLYIKNKQHSLLLIFTAVNLLWIIFKLPFYHRILIYSDLSVIIFAAYFLGQLRYSRKTMKASLVILMVFLFYRSAAFILAKQPMISEEEVLELKNFQEPPGFVLITSADDAPWVLAYTKNQRLGAPGLLEDPHTHDEWQDFWRGGSIRHFISAYPRPLYFYQRDYKLPSVQLSGCLVPVSKNFSKLDYACLESLR